MKSKFIMFLFCLVSCLNMQAQNAPTSVAYRKEHDFFLNVIANKKFTIYDFLCVGFRSRIHLLNQNKPINLLKNLGECLQKIWESTMTIPFI